MFVPPMLPQIPQGSAFLSQAKPPTPFHRHLQDLEKKLEDAVQEMDN